MRRTFGDLRSARARHRSCFWPCERLEPEDVMAEERLRKMFWFIGGVLGGVTAASSLMITVGESALAIGGGCVAGVPSSESDPMSWTRRRAVKISSSVKRPKGSRLL